MKARGLKDAQVARDVGVARPTISRLRRGLQRPSWEMVAAIRKYTNGAVTGDDWDRRHRRPTQTASPEASPAE